MASVMISHSHKDVEPPTDVAMMLAAEDVNVAFDKWSVGLGDSLIAFMDEGLDNATHVILMWSKNAAESGWVREERRAALAQAVNTGKPKVIVVRLDNEPLPPLLSDRRYHRWKGGTEEDRDALVNAVLARSPGDSYVRAVVRKAAELTIDLDGDNPLPYKACTSCGSSRLEFSHAADHAHDRLYFFVKCEECGWGDWSE